MSQLSLEGQDLVGLREEYRHFHPEDRRRENHIGIQRGDVFRVVDGITLVVGATTSALEDMQELLDGNVYTITEAGGVPGLNLEVFFNKIREIYWFYARILYQGGANHGIRIQLQNVGTMAWDTFHTFAGPGIDYESVYFPIHKGHNYIAADGTVNLRFYHTEVGNPAHVFNVDYVALVA